MDRLWKRKTVERRSAPDLTLYASAWCPYCMMVFHALDALDLDVRRVDPRDDVEARRALYEARGHGTVPVLRIDHPDGRVEWMPESRDIVRWLRARYAVPAPAGADGG